MSAPVTPDLARALKEDAEAILGYHGCRCPSETRNDPALICRWCLFEEVLTRVARDAAGRERERCAKVADEYAKEHRGMVGLYHPQMESVAAAEERVRAGAAEAIAAAIRAGQEGK